MPTDRGGFFVLVDPAPVRWRFCWSRRDLYRFNKLVTRLADMVNSQSLPFDARRMFFGGFKVLVQA